MNGVIRSNNHRVQLLGVLLRWQADLFSNATGRKVGMMIGKLNSGSNRQSNELAERQNHFLTELR